MRQVPKSAFLVILHYSTGSEKCKKLIFGGPMGVFFGSPLPYFGPSEAPVRVFLGPVFYYFPYENELSAFARVKKVIIAFWYDLVF